MINQRIFKWIMEQPNYQLNFKAWIYAYYVIFHDFNLIDRFKDNALNFTELDECPHGGFQRPQLPESMLKNEAQFVEFWGSVKYWCTVTLTSPFYSLIHGGRNTGGGLGLAAKYDCEENVIMRHVIGLLQICTKSQSDQLEMFGFDSMYTMQSGSSDKVYILYGPAMLLNHSKNTPMQFMDRDYVQNTGIFWSIHKLVLKADKSEVTELFNVRGVQAFTNRNILFKGGEQILINYNNGSNYESVEEETQLVDLSCDSDSEQHLLVDLSYDSDATTDSPQPSASAAATAARNSRRAGWMSTNPRRPVLTKSVSAVVTTMKKRRLSTGRFEEDEEEWFSFGSSSLQGTSSSSSSSSSANSKTHN